jgi:uncharacterized protein (TIGR00299 family) protein
MRIGYFDCFSGVSGDMILGALVDAGLALERLQAGVAALGVPGISLSAERVRRGAFTGTLVHVRTDERGHPHRHLADVEAILNQAPLPDPVRADATRIFRRLAEAEAGVHGTTPDRVHFHEVGALDALADVVGAAWGIRELGLERLAVSAINLGGGFVQAAHGKMPVPAPGTAALLVGAPAYGSEVPLELATPTGVAVLTTLAREYGPLPPMTVERIAYGAGQRELANQANLLRLIVGESAAAPGRDHVAVLEATIDDMNPQFFEPLMERLFEAGALDVTLTPVIMKKSRPGTVLTVLVDPGGADRCAGVILRHSTTLGVRSHPVGRWTLPRDIVRVTTPHGEVRVKRAWLDGRPTVVAPEFDDCRRLAQASAVPVQVVFDAARRAALALEEPGDPAGPRAAAPTRDGSSRSEPIREEEP